MLETVTVGICSFSQVESSPVLVLAKPDLLAVPVTSEFNRCFEGLEDIKGTLINGRRARIIYGKNTTKFLDRVSKLSKERNIPFYIEKFGVHNLLIDGSLPAATIRSDDKACRSLQKSEKFKEICEKWASHLGKMLIFADDPKLDVSYSNNKLYILGYGSHKKIYDFPRADAIDVSAAHYSGHTRTERAITFYGIPCQDTLNAAQEIERKDKVKIPSFEGSIIGVAAKGGITLSFPLSSLILEVGPDKFAEAIDGLLSHHCGVVCSIEDSSILLIDWMERKCGDFGATYVDEMLCHCEQMREGLTQDLKYAEEAATRLRETFTLAVREKEKLKLAMSVHTEGKDQLRERLKRGFISVIKHVDVKALWCTGESLHVVTNRLTGTSSDANKKEYDLGELHIVCNLHNLNQISIHNLVSECIHNGMAHPHIGTEGGICWGTADTMIQEFAARYDIPMFVNVLLQVIKQVNPDGHPYVESWRKK